MSPPTRMGTKVNFWSSHVVFFLQRQRRVCLKQVDSPRSNVGFRRIKVYAKAIQMRTSGATSEMSNTLPFFHFCVNFEERSDSIHGECFFFLYTYQYIQGRGNKKRQEYHHLTLTKNRKAVQYQKETLLDVPSSETQLRTKGRRASIQRSLWSYGWWLHRGKMHRLHLRLLGVVHTS